MENKPKVLFLCTGNSARSQMAEGFVRHLSGDHIIAVSAGVEPRPVNPLAIRVMREVGIDISGQRSKTVLEILKEHFAFFVGVCDMTRERCPIFPFAYKLLRWSLEDPTRASGTVDQQLPVFRRVRDEVEHNVREFLIQESFELAELEPKLVAAR